MGEAHDPSASDALKPRLQQAEFRWNACRNWPLPHLERGKPCMCRGEGCDSGGVMKLNGELLTRHGGMHL